MTLPHRFTPTCYSRGLSQGQAPGAQSGPPTWAVGIHPPGLLLWSPSVNLIKKLQWGADLKSNPGVPGGITTAPNIAFSFCFTISERMAHTTYSWNKNKEWQNVEFMGRRGEATNRWEDKGIACMEHLGLGRLKSCTAKLLGHALLLTYGPHLEKQGLLGEPRGLLQAGTAGTKILGTVSVAVRG